MRRSILAVHPRRRVTARHASISTKVPPIPSALRIDAALLAISSPTVSTVVLDDELVDLLDVLLLLDVALEVLEELEESDAADALDVVAAVGLKLLLLVPKPR